MPFFSVRLLKRQQATRKYRKSGKLRPRWGQGCVLCLRREIAHFMSSTRAILDGDLLAEDATAIAEEAA